MRCLNRNKVNFHYLLFVKKTPVVDENGHLTGEYQVIYGAPEMMKANISAAKGETQTEQFGNDVKYDKVIVTEDVNCPIDENSVLFVDKEPEFDEFGNPLFDYVVKKVAKSLNSISYAISKVSVT